MRILHTIAGLWKNTGGPVFSVTSLCRGLANRGHEVTLLTGEGDLHPRVEALRSVVRVETVRLGPYRLANWSRAFASACEREAKQVDLVHDHGVWLYTNWASARAARRTGRPLVRSPRGMLSPWSLGRSGLRKQLVWRTVERTLFDQASLVHATSALEEREIRQVGIHTPTVVIPNGLDLEGDFPWTRMAEFREARAKDREMAHSVLFLSRLHPKKGLDLLRAAWESLPPSLPFLLLVAGMGEPSEIARTLDWVSTQAGPPARYLGPVDGDRKLALLATSRLLVLPSHSENYGIAVAEALACGTPVLTTTATPWSELGAQGCGWVIPVDVASLRQALWHALTIDESELRGMRMRARAFVEKEHSLTTAITRMEQAYLSLRGPGTQSDHLSG